MVPSVSLDLPADQFAVAEDGCGHAAAFGDALGGNAEECLVRFVAGRQEAGRAQEYFRVAAVDVLEILVQERNTIDLEDNLIFEPGCPGLDP